LLHETKKELLGFQKWDTAAKGPSVTISNDGATATSTSGSWETVRAVVCMREYVLCV